MAMVAGGGVVGSDAAKSSEPRMITHDSDAVTVLERGSPILPLLMFRRITSEKDTQTFLTTDGSRLPIPRKKHPF